MIDEAMEDLEKEGLELLQTLKKEEMEKMEEKPVKKKSMNVAYFFVVGR